MEQLTGITSTMKGLTGANQPGRSPLAIAKFAITIWQWFSAHENQVT
jgi:hypothetical protein